MTFTACDNCLSIIQFKSISQNVRSALTESQDP